MRELPSGDVTFVFTDIEGSTRLFHRLGDRYPELLAAHNRVVRAIFTTEYGGIELRTGGDGFFFAFPDARSAATAAVRAQEVLASEPWPGDAAVRIRIGMHSAEARPVDGDYVTLAVHLAARISAAANGGQTIVSEATADRLANWDEGCLQGLGRFWLRDFGEPVRLYCALPVGTLDQNVVRPRARAADSNLPEPAPEVMGRESDIATVRKLLHEGRAVTIVGPGGTGKTTLALAVAHAEATSFPGGAWFVDLSTVDRNEDVAGAVARAVTGATDGDPRQALVGALPADERALLVIDSCEHVLEGVVALDRELLAASGRLVILSTSRLPLGMSVERSHRLGGLDSSQESGPAVQLFLERAAVVRPGFDPSPDQLGAVAAICASVDGLPLAIELAAARVAVLEPTQLRSRLENVGASLLRRSDNGRHAAMDTVLQWSYEQLSERERQLLRWLSVLPGPVPLELALAAGSESGDEVIALDGLESLMAKSLVVRTDDAQLRLLAPIRDFAVRRRSPEEERSALLRVAEELVRWAADSESEDEPGETLADHRALVRRALLTAVDSDSDELVVRMAATFGQSWDSWGDWDLHEPIARKLLSCAPDGELWPLGMAAAAWLAWRSGNPDSATALAEQALRYARAGVALGRIHHVRAVVALEGGSFEEARTQAALAATAYERGGDGRSVLAVRYNLGALIEAWSGNIEAAVEIFRVGIDASADTPVIQALLLMNYGRHLQLVGDAQAAVVVLERAVDLWRRFRASQYMLATNLEVLAAAEATAGHVDQAQEHLAEAATYRSRHTRWGLLAAAEIALADGRIQEASKCLAGIPPEGLEDSFRRRVERTRAALRSAER